MSQRKQNLLLASQLARDQVVRAFNEVADQADTVAERVAMVRRWLAQPVVWLSASAAGVLALARLRRLRPARAIRWGWLAWRVWRSLVKRT